MLAIKSSKIKQISENHCFCCVRVHQSKIMVNTPVRGITMAYYALPVRRSATPVISYIRGAKPKLERKGGTQACSWVSPLMSSFGGVDLFRATSKKLSKVSEPCRPRSGQSLSLSMATPSPMD